MVLRSGETIEGEVTLADDRYRVLVDRGEVLLRARDVAACVRSLDEAYQFRRDSMLPGDVRGHLELAVWCHRRGLHGQAAEEMAAARSIDPNHPLIAITERRMTAPAADPPMLIQGSPSAAPLPPPAVPEGPRWEDLERLAGDMPPGSVETFTQFIQPLLVNRCATSGCHGPGASAEHRLNRLPPVRTSATRRLTQENLAVVLGWINRENPKASPLLTAPLAAHGRARIPVFAHSEVPQYRMLAEWVNRVARPPPSAAPPKPEAQPITGFLPTASAQMLNARENGLDPPEPGGVEPASANLPIDEPAGPLAVGPTGEPLPPSLMPRPKLQRGAPLPELAPADPFDPNEFNRRYHPPGLR